MDKRSLEFEIYQILTLSIAKFFGVGVDVIENIASSTINDTIQKIMLEIREQETLPEEID